LTCDTQPNNLTGPIISTKNCLVVSWYFGNKIVGGAVLNGWERKENWSVSNRPYCRILMRAYNLARWLTRNEHDARYGAGGISARGLNFLMAFTA